MSEEKFHPYSESYKSTVAPSLFTSMFGVFNPYAAIAELCDNAIDSGSKTVRVRYSDCDKSLEVIDSGCGISKDQIKYCLDFGYKHREDDETKIGCHNVGLKAAMFLLINQDSTKRILTTIETVKDGFKTLVEKKIDLGTNSEGNVTSEISYSTTFKGNGTKIHFDGVFLDRAVYEQCKMKLRARYYNLINEGKIELFFDDNSVPEEGIDMLYRGHKEVNVNKEIITCEDDKGQFPVEISICQMSGFFKKDSEDQYHYDIESMNELDNSMAHKCASGEYSGVYLITHGIYHTLGGDDSWQHLGRRRHSYLNKARIEIKIPDSRKHYIANALKSQAKRFIRDIMTVDGNQVFKPVFDWFTLNSPSRMKRIQLNEDKMKRVRQEYAKNSEGLAVLSSEISHVVNEKYKDDQYLNSLVAELAKVVNSCSNGTRVYSNMKKNIQSLIREKIENAN